MVNDKLLDLILRLSSDDIFYRGKQSEKEKCIREASDRIKRIQLLQSEKSKYTGEIVQKLNLIDTLTPTPSVDELFKLADEINQVAYFGRTAKLRVSYSLFYSWATTSVLSYFIRDNLTSLGLGVLTVAVLNMSTVISAYKGHRMKRNIQERYGRDIFDRQNTAAVERYARIYRGYQINTSLDFLR